MVKLFVWDFHGVLEKGNEKTVLEVSNEALEFFGYKERFTEKDVDKLYGKGWKEYFEYLLPNLSDKDTLKLYNKCHEIANNNLKRIKNNVQPTDNAHFVLKSIEESGHSQIVISRTSEDGLNFFLDSIEIFNHFPKGFSFGVENNNFKFIKPEVLRKFLKGKNFDDIVIIGDSPTDIELKSVAGGTTYLYAHPGREFKKCEADYYIRDLRDILKEIS